MNIVILRNLTTTEFFHANNVKHTKLDQVKFSKSLSFIRKYVHKVLENPQNPN